MISSATSAEGIPLQTLSQTGQVPETRFEDAASVCDLVSVMRDANTDRNKTDAKVAGLVDGNPPYKASDLKAAGQSWRANANFREAEAFLAAASGSFYDILNEAPTYATVKIDYGTPEDRVRLSRIVTEEYDRLNKADTTLDYTFQLSQREMVLFGLGPVMWENEFDWRARAIPKNKFMVPDGTASKLDDWEVAVVLVDYLPHQLYGFIKDEKAATQGGWKPEAVKAELVAAAPTTEGDQAPSNWMEIQRQIRNNDLNYSARSKVVQVAHVYYREFRKGDELSGKISHVIVPAKSTGATDRATFLYRKLNQYERWEQVICPFYYDVGDGTHHSVKGMGVKFYSALELKNRLGNTVVDCAFERAKMPIRVQSVEAAQSFQIVPSGPFTLYPPGTEPIPLPTGGVLDAPMAVSRDLLATVSSNLSQYRQNLQRDKGNPITAAEVQVRAEQQSLLGKTQISRYYAQLDSFWHERYIRLVSPKLTNLSPGGAAANEFKKRCLERGIPENVLRRIESVKATRVAGQGSPFLRQMALQRLLQLSAMIGNDGRVALLEDVVGAEVGQDMVARYMPASDREKIPTHDAWEASQEHTSMKVGNPAMVVGSQNHIVHLESHLNAGAQALNSLQQGGDMLDVYGFVTQIGAHSAAHLDALSQDQTRKREFDLLEKQWNEFAGIVDDLRQQVEKSQQQQQQAVAAQQKAQSIMSGTDPDTQIKAAQAVADIKLKNKKAASDIQRKNLKTRQDMALKDVKMASSIRQSARKQAADTALEAKEK